MKQISIALNILLLSIIIFNACNKKSKNNGKIDNRTKPGFVFNKDSMLCYDCAGATFGGVTKRDFYEGILRYKKTHWRELNTEYRNSRYPDGITNFEDSRSCWYSFETLQRFMCLVKQYSNCLHIPADRLGINLYYAVYNNSAQDHEDNRSHQTIFMVPSVIDKGGNIFDFDPRLSCSEHPGVPPTDLEKFQLSDFLLILDPNSPMAQNQGKLCPPHCTAATSLYYADRFARSLNLPISHDDNTPVGLDFDEITPP